MLQIKNNLDYLTAMLHGRRSRMAEGDRLRELARIESFSQLMKEVSQESASLSISAWQRSLALSLAQEIEELYLNLDGAEAEFVLWIKSRFEVENIKIVLRSLGSNTPPNVAQEFMIVTKSDFLCNSSLLSAVKSAADLPQYLPENSLNASLRDTLNRFGPGCPLFLLETALDRGYLEQLLKSAVRLPQTSREAILPMVLQDADAFHVALVMRGRHVSGLEPDSLLFFHIRSTRITLRLFSHMLAAGSAVSAAAQAVGKAIDSAPPPSSRTGYDPVTEAAASCETQALRRFRRLANRAFLSDSTGIGCVAAYAGLRRVETANLIMISEGLRARIPNEEIAGRLIT